MNYACFQILPPSLDLYFRYAREMLQKVDFLGDFTEKQKLYLHDSF